MKVDVPEIGAAPAREVACPHCRAALALPARSPVGARARCGSCGDLFRVPDPELPRSPSRASESGIVGVPVSGPASGQCPDRTAQ